MGPARLSRMICTALLLAGPVGLPAQAGTCRHALAFGLDVSGSVDSREYRLQIDGLARALSDPEVAALLLAAPGAPVRLLIYEWSGPGNQRVIAPWREIANRAALDAFVAQLGATARRAASPATALGTAMRSGARLLADQRECAHRTLDISGDGRSNTGPAPRDVATGPLFDGLTVNALAIGDDAASGPGATGPLLDYFETQVIRGPGAFAEPAADFAAYASAMKRKLLRELDALVIGAAPAGPALNPPLPQAGGRT